jgi:hypothetical protein
MSIPNSTADYKRQTSEKTEKTGKNGKKQGSTFDTHLLCSLEKEKTRG